MIENAPEILLGLLLVWLMFLSYFVNGLIQRVIELEEWKAEQLKKPTHNVINHLSPFPAENV